MHSNDQSPGFAEQQKYEKYLSPRVKEKTIVDYVSMLNTVARILGRRLSADMVLEKSQIDDIADQLLSHGELEENAIRNYKTALRHYCRALNNTEPRR